MPPRRKRDQFLDWLSRILSFNGPSRPSGSTGFFTHAHDFTQNNPVINAIQGDNNTVTYVQGDRNLVSHVMGLLQQESIRGATHDSSARSPPPRCHPKTRIKLIARITTWFDCQDRQKLVLWITGPAGVGKSAIVQTFAEHLVKFEFLGASVFFSRPNKRDNPHGVFISIAYQLAARIDAYRDFVVEQLCRDPELIDGNMQAQFRTFIVEPFVGKRIGAGRKRWGILLDGLDELKGEDAQCEIIRLVTTFAHEHPDVPLVWIIASRPESHICDTFADDDLPRSYWSEDIPIDSTEACEDVDRFLRSEFQAIQKKSRRSVPRDWPSDTDYLKLTVAASGLFVYAQVVMQFIRDPEYSDPTTRFKILLSVIDRSNATDTTENPFVHLDTLYREILCSIPSNLWPTAKQLLCCALHWDEFARDKMPGLRTLRGMSIFLTLPPHSIYTCLLKCQSVLKVPDWKVAHKRNLTFLHASFADYLKDPRRSDKFYIGSVKEAVDDMYLRVLTIINECGSGDAGPVKVAWRNYCSKLHDEPSSRVMTKYDANVLRDVASCFARTMYFMWKAKSESSLHAQLRNIHMIKVSYYFDPRAMFELVEYLTAAEDEAIGLFRWAHLKDLKFGHLDWQMMSPASVRESIHQRGEFQWEIHWPHSKAALKEFISELESLVETVPELKVVILGGVPKGRIAVFSHIEQDIYYMIPYYNPQVKPVIQLKGGYCSLFYPKIATMSQ